jgi:hypothetical protein
MEFSTISMLIVASAFAYMIIDGAYTFIKE